MTIQGWIFLTLSITGVWALAIWCYYTLLTSPDPSDEEPQDR